MTRITGRTAGLVLTVCTALVLATTAGAEELGWTAGPMSSDGSTIRTDGNLVYAYSVLATTMNGVSFARAAAFRDAGMVSASPSPAGSKYGDFMVPSGVSGDLGTMLSHGWYWEGANGELSFTLTLTGLTAGKTYLVQLVSHRTSNSTLVSANGSTPVHIHGTHNDVDYTCGGSIVGIFEASGATEAVTVVYSENSSGMRPLNAIQVRELVEEVPTVVEPSIGSISARVSGATATISLADIVMGTDDECDPATSYSVSYVLNNAVPVLALENQSGKTASFEIANLVDGDYDCVAEIATDKNKMASTNVTFTVDSASLPFGDFNWLKSAIEGATNGATIGNWFSPKYSEYGSVWGFRFSMMPC